MKRFFLEEGRGGGRLKEGNFGFFFLLSLGRILVAFNYPYSPLYLFTYPCI